MWAWWIIGKTGWPITLAVIWALGVAVVSAKERIRAHRNRLAPDVSLLVKVDSEIAELRHQRRLFLNAGLKYCLPGAIVTVIGFVTVARRPGHTPTPPGFLFDLLTNPLTLGWIIVLSVAFGSFIWRARRVTRDEVRKQIDPRLAELEKLRHDIFTTE